MNAITIFVYIIEANILAKSVYVIMVYEDIYAKIAEEVVFVYMRYKKENVKIAEIVFVYIEFQKFFGKIAEGGSLNT